MRDLISRLDEGDDEGPPVCLGTLLSRLQYQSEPARVLACAGVSGRRCS